MIGCGIGFLLGTLIEIALAVVLWFARNRRTTGLFVATIVLGALGGNVLPILGSIFGLVANGQENNQQPAQAE